MARRVLQTYQRTHTFSNYQALGFSRVDTYVELLLVQLAAVMCCSSVGLYREAVRVQRTDRLAWGRRLEKALHRFRVSTAFKELAELKDSGRGASLGRYGFESVTRPKSYHFRSL